MSHIQQKINNSYESEPSSGNSNGSSIDTLTMGNHDLDISPGKPLNALLGLDGLHPSDELLLLHSNGAHGHFNPQTPINGSGGDHAGAGHRAATAAGSNSSGGGRRNGVTVTEAADRERVELAKIYFQRVFAESQHRNLAATRAVETTPTATSSAHGYQVAGALTSCSSNSSASNFGVHAQHGPFAAATAGFSSAEISDQDDKCRQQMLLQKQLGQNSYHRSVAAAKTSIAADVCDDGDDEGDQPNDDDERDDDGDADDDDDDDDNDDDEDDDDLSNVSVYSIEPSSSHDNETATSDATAVQTGASTATHAAPVLVAAGVTGALQRPSVFVAENSCNAVDHQIATTATVATTSAVRPTVSFDGCFRSAMSTREHELSLLQAERSSFMQSHNEQSPDLFEESEDENEDDADADDVDDAEGDVDVEDEDVADAAEQHHAEERANGELMPDRRAHIHASEKTVLGRIQTSLSGLLPPPSVTILQYDILEMLSMYKQNSVRMAELPADLLPTALACVDGRSEFRPTHSAAEVAQLAWPDCQDAKAHGLHYNRSECTESIELLCMRYAERNIGAETASTFAHQSPSSSKKRNMRIKQLTAKSPGNRLSHLAHRRAIFSSANLLNKSNVTEASKLGKNQLVIDTRSRERGRAGASNKVKTPKRRTPSRKRTPGRKTPGSSHKRLVFRGLGGASSVAATAAAVANAAMATIRPSVPATRETSKRALFQSPPQEKPRPQFAADVAHRVERSKRVLFSPLPPSHRPQSSSTSVPQTPDPPSASSGTVGARRSVVLQHRGSALRFDDDVGDSSSRGAFQMPPKRKRDSDTPSQMGPSAKMPRLASAAAINLDNLTPRTMKLAKSQSFSVTAATGMEFRAAAALHRATSDQTIGLEAPLLSDVHRKKIFWATATALKNKKIASQHSNYVQYASVLAKVIKRFYLELADRKNLSTSTTLLKIAEKHVFWVLQGKTEDEIYLNEKHRTDQDVKLTKVTGYVAPEEYELRKSLLMRSRSNVSSVFGSASQSSLYGTGNDSLSLFGSQQQPSINGHQLLSQNSVTASQIAEQSSQQPEAAAATSSAVQSIDLSALCTDHRLQLSASKARVSLSLGGGGGCNSTSKSNTKTGVLRENDQRQRSAQKLASSVFSGRDQKNVSPFSGVGSRAGLVGSMGKMRMGGAGVAGVGAGISANIMKAKRQISFDS